MNPSYPFDRHYLDLDGIRLHYLDEGPADAEPIVMLHGNPTWSFYYRKLVLALRSRYRCVVPDHVGMGLSDKPTDARYSYTLQQRVDDLDQLLSDLHLKDNLTLVLHDWGGILGMHYAIRHRERVTNVVLMSTSVAPVRMSPVVGALILAFGWRSTWGILAGAMLLVNLPLVVVFMRRQPEDIGLLPDGDIPSEDDSADGASSLAASAEHQWTRAEAIRTREFWQLSTVFSLFVLATNSMLIFRVVHFISNGVDPSLIAWGAGSAQLGAILGAVTIGRQVAFAGLERLNTLRPRQDSRAAGARGPTCDWMNSTSSAATS